jgi:hypothetical protein
MHLLFGGTIDSADTVPEAGETFSDKDFVVMFYWFSDAEVKNYPDELKTIRS